MRYPDLQKFAAERKLELNPAGAGGSDVLPLHKIAKLFGLPDLDDLVELNADYIAEQAHAAQRAAEAEGEDAEKAWEEASHAAENEIVDKWSDAVLAAATELFGAHGLDLEERKPRGKALRIWEYKVVPQENWRDAADKIRGTINGVGMFHFSSLKEFLDSGPWTAREAVLQHLSMVRRYPDVYGTSSARRLYEGGWRGNPAMLESDGQGTAGKVGSGHARLGEARQGMAGSAKNPPPGLTARGVRMYEAIKTGYEAEGDPRAREIAARTVRARASEGAPGLVRNAARSRLPTYDERKGWTGGDSRTLYAFTDRRTGGVTILPGPGAQGITAIGPEVTVRVATRAEAEEGWQSPLHRGWTVRNPVANPASESDLATIGITGDAAGRVLKAIDKGEEHTALVEASKAMDGFGVEAIRSETAWDRYFGDSIALYVNMGDTYVPTLLFDIEAGEYLVTSWGDWLEGWEQRKSQESTETAGGMRDEILESMTRTLWVTAYASFIDNELEDGKTRKELEDAGYPSAGAGDDWMDIAPDTPDGVDKAAEALAKAYEDLNGKSITELLARAAEADGFEEGQDRIAFAANLLADTDYAREFGHYLAMMALGEGVGWFDDHAEFPLKTPFAWESNYDGAEFSWSGRAR